MKTYIAILALFCASSCASTPEKTTQSTDSEKAFEAMLLWKKDADTKPIAKAIESEQGFKREGNFYQPTDSFNVFGFPAEYVGLLGLDLLAGPNATVKASPHQVAQAIKAQYGLQFEKHDDAYRSILGENLSLYLFPHPNLSGRTIIIGSYEGP